MSSGVPASNTPPSAFRACLPLRLRNGSNTREHWAVRHHRAATEKAAVDLLIPRRDLPALPVVVTITRIGRRMMDGDGNIIAAKHVRDAIAAKYGVDDADARIAWRYGQRIGKTYAVDIDIIAAGEAAELRGEMKRERVNISMGRRSPRETIRQNVYRGRPQRPHIAGGRGPAIFGEGDEKEDN